MVCSFFLVSFKDRRSIAGLNENRLVREVDNARRRRMSQRPGDFTAALSIGIRPCESQPVSGPRHCAMRAPLGAEWGRPVAIPVPRPGGTPRPWVHPPTHTHVAKR